MNESIIVSVALVSFSLGIGALLIALAIRRWRQLTWIGRISWIVWFAGWTLGSVGFYSDNDQVQKAGFYVMFSGMFAWVISEYFSNHRK